jgi:hypothetical protein
VESFVAITNVYLLKFSLQHFKEILERFPDIKDEIDMIANEREKMRLILIRDNQVVME